MSGASRRSRRPHATWPIPGRYRGRVLLTQVVLIAVFLLAWERSSGNPAEGAMVDELFFGKPTQIWGTAIRWLADGTFVSNAWPTLQEVLEGFLVGGLIGVSTGIVVGATEAGQRVIAPLVFALNSIPRIALAPLFILWFGIGMESKIVFVSFTSFFYTFFSAFEGSRQVDRELVDISRIMQASRWQIVQKVILPSSMLWVAVGLKLNVPHAFTAAIAAEILAGNFGLGRLIWKSGLVFDPNGMFAAILFTTVMAITLNWLIGHAVNRGLGWRQVGGSQQVEQAPL